MQIFEEMKSRMDFSFAENHFWGIKNILRGYARTDTLVPVDKKEN